MGGIGEQVGGRCCVLLRWVVQGEWQDLSYGGWLGGDSVDGGTLLINCALVCLPETEPDVCEVLA